MDRWEPVIVSDRPGEWIEKTHIAHNIKATVPENNLEGSSFNERLRSLLGTNPLCIAVREGGACGIDLHSTKSWVAILDDQLKVVREKGLGNNLENILQLLPILWATGTGADVTRRIAAPMVGGIVTSFFGELLVYPAIYFIWRSAGLRKTVEVES